MEYLLVFHLSLTTLGGACSYCAHVKMCGLANFSNFPVATQLGAVFYLKINTLLSDSRVHAFSLIIIECFLPFSSKGPFLLLGSSFL